MAINKNYAVVRLPACTLPKALRMKNLGEVDLTLARSQHKNYCKALGSLGFTLVYLPEEDRFPDSVFVEDPAIIIRDALIITRLRAPSRQGEEALLEKALTPFFPRTFRIEPPGFIEGGDVLITDSHVYIGLSKRTNAEGAEQLAKIARDVLGYAAVIFEIPESYLHMKGEASYHSAQNIITVSEEISRYFSDSGCKLIITPAEERFGGNNISQNGNVLIHKGRKRTKALLEKEGFTTQEIDLSEFEKVDGAMTCLSKLFAN